MPVTACGSKEIFFTEKQPPVAILFWVPCAKYIIRIYRNWNPLDIQSEC